MGCVPQGWGLPHPAWGVFPGMGSATPSMGCVPMQRPHPAWGLPHPAWVYGVCPTQHEVCSQGWGLSHPAWGVVSGMGSAAHNMGCVARDGVCRTQHGVCSQGQGLTWGVFSGMGSDMGCVFRDGV